MNIKDLSDCELKAKLKKMCPELSQIDFDAMFLKKSNEKKKK
mgnify:FL=1|jgi:hypothetical protein